MFEGLEQYLDEYEKELLSEIKENLDNNKSQINHCIFAFSLRSLFETLQGRLAPVEKVMKSSWYKAPNELMCPKCNNKFECTDSTYGNTRKVTRTQQYKYILQGSYDDYFLRNILTYCGIDDYAKQLNKIMGKLSAKTHITKEIYNYNGQEKKEYIDEIENSINEFLSIFDKIKNEIEEHLGEYLFEIVNDTFISETLEEIDTMATHYYIDYVDVEEKRIIPTSQFILNSEITSLFIEVNGNINVEHQIGSDNDLKKGDGLTFEYSHPYEITYEFSIPLLEDLIDGEIEDYTDDELKELYKNHIVKSFEVIEKSINTDKYYEEYYT